MTHDPIASMLVRTRGTAGLMQKNKIDHDLKMFDAAEVENADRYALTYMKARCHSLIVTGNFLSLSLSRH